MNQLWRIRGIKGEELITPQTKYLWRVRTAGSMPRWWVPILEVMQPVDTQ